MAMTTAARKYRFIVVLTFGFLSVPGDTGVRCSAFCLRLLEQRDFFGETRRKCCRRSASASYRCSAACRWQAHLLTRAVLARAFAPQAPEAHYTSGASHTQTGDAEARSRAFALAQGCRPEPVGRW